MVVLSTNPGYASCEQQTTHEWVASIFAGGRTCLLQEESLTLEEEIGEGAFGKVFRGLNYRLQLSDSHPTFTIIIRPHRSTTYEDAAYCYRPSSVVCRSVCHTSEPCKND